MHERNQIAPDEIVLFIAMPYSDMGDPRNWTPARVEKFYEYVRLKIELTIQRPVRMRIEKYSRETGLVIDSMFRAIAEADVFIADMTNWNVNVALELGIRFGVSRKLTIITSQEQRSLPFDLNQMRFVRYGNRASQEAEEEIADIVKSKLDDRDIGSPVLKLLDLEVVPRAQWAILAGDRVKALLDASKRSEDADSQLGLVNQAVSIDPFSLQARIALAKVHRTLERFEDAIVSVESALKVFPRATELLKEMGLTYDRMSSRETNPAQLVRLLDKAGESFAMALGQGVRDADLHCCYGGVLRRKAFASSAHEREALLSESLRHYEMAIQIERHSTYAGLNVTRLMLLMSTNSNLAQAYLQRMFHLCSFEVEDSRLQQEGEAWWKMFDLADVFAMMSDTDKSLCTYESAICEIPPQKKRDVLLSPRRTWEEFLRANVMRKDAERILELFDRSDAGSKLATN